MKWFVIIKGESQRIPNKSMAVLGEKPLYAHLLGRLKGNDVWVDTDSDDIARDISRRMPWVRVYKRWQEHVDMEGNEDVSPVLSITERFLDDYCQDDDIVVTPHVTSPFLRPFVVAQAVQAMIRGGYDSVSSVVGHREFCMNSVYMPVNYTPEVVQRTQDLPPVYFQNGAFYAFTKRSFKEAGHRVSESHLWWDIAFPDSFEIDWPEDLEVARCLLRGGIYEDIRLYPA